jgi:predicted dehydrogenase
VSELRVGVIGAGDNTRARHLPNLQAIDGVRVVTVCNRSQASGELVARDFSIPRVETDWRRVTGDPEVDAVVIGTWPDSHPLLTCAALTGGKHVLCEARMARTAREARRMLRAAQSRPDLVAQLVPGPATLRVDRTVRRLLTEEYLGDVLAVDVRIGATFADREAPFHWRYDRDISGVNIMLLGVWYECVMRWIGEATSVAATAATVVRTRRDGDGRLRSITIPDHVDVLAEMACGAAAHFQVSAVTGLAGPPTATLYGSDGTLRFSAGRLLGGRRGDDDLRELEIPPEEEGGWRVEEEFIGAIRGEEQVRLTTFADGVKNMEFAEAVVQSLRDRRNVLVRQLGT